MRGFTVVIDMAGASWKQFDTKILNKFLLALQDHFPGRLRKFSVVNASMWVSVMSKAIVPLMKPKFAAKILLVDRKGFPPTTLCSCGWNDFIYLF